MLTREQWENLARFAGVEYAGECSGKSCVILSNAILVDFKRAAVKWRPLRDWNDFGPLLILLLRWVDETSLPPGSLAAAQCVFVHVKRFGTEQELMETGCLLGAAIGATMEDK